MNVLKMFARIIAILAMSALLTFGSIVMESAIHVTTREGIERC